MPETSKDQAMHDNPSRLTLILIMVLTFEKMIQHAATALFFAIDIPGIGTPDIGTRFHLDNMAMIIANLAYLAVIVVGFLGVIKRKDWGLWIVLAMALLDIMLEFMFHGLFFITISVIVSLILSAACLWHLKTIRQMAAAGASDAE